MASMIKATESDRPSFPHRLSVTSNSTGSYGYKVQPRSYSNTQTLSVGAGNPGHRISRRKSSSSTAINKEVIMAALVGGHGLDFSKRGARSTSQARTNASATTPASMPNTSALSARLVEERAMADSVAQPSLASLLEDNQDPSKSRTRRDSDTVRVGKDGKKLLNAHGELKCDTCGKGYKHSSCLTKHLWEHTPEWQLTSKLLISKHQQVQLLEAASVLIAMNQEAGTSALESDSSSPEISGSSDINDSEMSSVEMTPPPQREPVNHSSRPRTPANHVFDHDKRGSEPSSSSYSRSYQSSIFSKEAGTSYASHHRQWSNDDRPMTSGGGFHDDDDSSSEQADLAAAVGLLSCSYGTPKTGPITLANDVPPVPTLPIQFLGSKQDGLSGSTVTMSGPRQSYSYLRGRRSESHQSHGEWGSHHVQTQDLEMNDEDQEQERELELRRANMQVEGLDDDDLVFGRME